MRGPTATPLGTADRGTLAPLARRRDPGNSRTAERARLGRPHLPPRPRARGDLDLDHTEWNGEEYEHFPNVMPYTVRSLAWSAKRKRQRVKETQAWREEMRALKSQWSGHSHDRDEGSAGTATDGVSSSLDDDCWHWCTHSEAVRGWEEERRSWAGDRERAFRIAQQRLESFRASSQGRARPHQVHLPERPDPDPLGLYGLMGISTQATLEELKGAFRAKAKDLHPDVARGQGAAVTDSDEAMKALLRAYAVLKDPKSRTLYDNGLLPGA